MPRTADQAAFTILARKLGLQQVRGRIERKLTIDQLAALLGSSPRSVRRWLGRRPAFIPPLVMAEMRRLAADR